MGTRPLKHEISKPKPIAYPTLHATLPVPPTPPPPPPPPPSRPSTTTKPDDRSSDPIAWSSGNTRPLSDIRELSEPSLMDNVFRQRPNGRLQHGRNASRSHSTKRAESLKPAAPDPPKKPAYVALQVQEGGSSSYSSTPEQQSSFYSIPQSSVPRRSSSQSYSLRQPRSHTRNPSIRSKPQASLQPLPNRGHYIPNRGGMDSPVKEVGLKLDPVSSDSSRRVPSKTHVRNPQPIDILEFPSFKHPRVKLELLVSAPLFVGGGTVEGNVRITVDDNERVARRRSLSIGAVSVDVLGFEELGSSRKSTFLALGTDIVDANHPPPMTMIQPMDPLFADDRFWSLAPSCSTIPFMISLPLDTGPPPFQSKHANIRFVLTVTAFLRDAGKHYRVRTSQDINVLPTYDPEKALTSLPSPLTASDELMIPRSTGVESVKVTAGLHRQAWVSGSSIFVDVHVSNRSRKPVKRLELLLERDILFYKHAAAATLNKSAGPTRIFDNNEKSILARAAVRSGSVGFNGVEPHTSETRTCELELPRGHATVRCGKYFEVRYFLNVVASLSNSRNVSVQLPIILIHMNSLDVVPNSVAQVAAAMEERRAIVKPGRSRTRRGDGTHSRQRSLSSPARSVELRRQPSFAQGRAFAAPRQQSLDRQRERVADIEDLRHMIDASPRKHPPPSVKGLTIKKVASNVSLGALRLGNISTETLGVLGAMSYLTPSPRRRSGDVDKDTGSIRDRVRRMGSLDSLRSKKSTTAFKQPYGKLQTGTQAHLTPYVLGLTASTRKLSADVPSDRSASATGYREKLDRSRFEFKAVKTKASGNLKERGMAWWDQRKPTRDREKESPGWI